MTTRSLTRPRTGRTIHSTPARGISLRNCPTGRPGLAVAGVTEVDDREPNDVPERVRPKPAEGRGDTGDVGDDGLPISEEEKDKRRRKQQEESSERQREEADKGTPVESPGSDKSAIGPMGDASHNVGYSQARADAKRFHKAFGMQGLEWFAQGKTFAQAKELYDEQRRQVSTRTLRQNGIVGGVARFARGIAKQLRRK